jgi:hypothetical protein
MLDQSVELGAVHGVSSSFVMHPAQPSGIAALAVMPQNARNVQYSLSTCRGRVMLLAGNGSLSGERRVTAQLDVADGSGSTAAAGTNE